MEDKNKSECKKKKRPSYKIDFGKHTEPKKDKIRTIYGGGSIF